MADEKLIFDVLQGQNTLAKGLSDTSKSISGIEKQLQTIGKKIPKDVFKGALGAELVSKAFDGLLNVGGKIAGVFSDAIHEATAAEDALKSLEAALLANGTASESVIRDFQEFASQVQENSKIDDDAVISNLALLRSLTNLSDKGLKVAFNAANDLSAALNIDLTTATELVAKAANGQVTAFQRYGLAVKAGKNEVDTFNNVLQALSVFQGRAAAQVDTFSGATAQLTNNFGDLLQSIGEIIVKNPEIIGLIKSISGVIKDLTSSLVTDGPKISKVISDTIVGFKSLAKNTGDFAKTSEKTRDASQGFFASLADGLVSVGKTSDTLIDAEKKTEQLEKSTKKAAVSLDGLFQARKKPILDDADIKKVTEFVAGLQKVTNVSIFANIEAEFAERQRKLQQLIDIGATEDLRTAREIEEARFLIGKAFDQQRATILSAQTREISTSLFGAIRAGTGGAQQILGFALDKVSDAVKSLPVIGQIVPVVGEALKFFAQGPEAVKQQTKAFVDALAQLPRTLLASAPVFVSELLRLLTINFPAEFAKAAPDAVRNLVNAIIPQLPAIIQALQESFIQAAIIQQTLMPQIAVAFSTALIANSPKIVSAFARGMIAQSPFIAFAVANELIKQAPNIARETALAFVDAFRTAGKDFFKGGGQVAEQAGSFISDVGNFLGFADGGVVPGNPAKGDSVPALLTPGEAVVPTSIVDKIDKLAENNNQPQQVTVVLQLGQDVLAKAMFDLSKQGYRLA